MNDSLPTWTDVAQTVIGTLGIAATVITLWKLMKKDEDREKEIANLSVIASQLKDMMALSETRYVESKIPRFKVDYTRVASGRMNVVILHNENSNGRISNYEISEVAENVKITQKHDIYEEGGFQKIRFLLTYDKDVFRTKLLFRFVVDSKYVYTQYAQCNRLGEVLKVQLSSITLIDTIHETPAS